MVKTVVIADDHAFTIEGMVAVVETIPQIKVVGVAENGIEAISLIKTHKPDCALLDLTMPGANGLEAFIEAKRWSPDTRFAIITGNASASIFKELVDAGIDGIFLKNAPSDEICHGIEQVLKGHKIVSKDAENALKNARDGESLTSRELEVLQNIARGQSNREIADTLGISPKTIESHRSSLMRKLDAHSTATLLVRAMRDGLLDV